MKKIRDVVATSNISRRNKLPSRKMVSFFGIGFYDDENGDVKIGRILFFIGEESAWKLSRLCGANGSVNKKFEEFRDQNSDFSRPLFTFKYSHIEDCIRYN